MTGNCKQCLGGHMLHDQGVPELHQRYGACDATHPLYA